MSTTIAERSHRRHTTANGRTGRRRVNSMTGARLAMTVAPAVMYARRNPVRSILIVTAGLGAVIGLLMTRRLFGGR